ncbi:hypothetical protein FACS1894145_5700 [Bacteroidia bacterium]|nr:hypothetical protein FACS1894145_5700 [Bacteroidia bacterium]
MGFTEEWEITTVADECIINPKTNPLDSEFVYIDLESVVKGELTKEVVISKSEAPSRAQRVLDDYDILFQCVRPYQMNNYIFRTSDDRQWVASTGYAQIRTNNNPLFVYHLLNTPKFNREVMVRCTGTSYPAISSDDLSEIAISICSSEEQNKIASFLSLIDERIATQIKIIDKLESLIKALNNNLKETYGNEIEISLQQLGTSYSGLSGKSAEDFGDGKPFVTYMNVYKNIVIDENMVDYVNIDKDESQNKIQYGDALFTVSSEAAQEIGMSAVYLGNNKELYLNSFCFGFRPTNFETLHPEYLPYLFSNKQFRKFILPFAQGSTRFNLLKTDLLNKKFKIPTIVNQRRISNILNALSKKLEIEQDILSGYVQQKMHLLQQMFI